jgi:dephospho-CoA kinase
MKVIGIIGGIAGGKTWVAQALGRWGAAVIEADRLGHAVLETAEVKRQLRQRWGEGVFGPDGQVDRAAVARRVFAPPPSGPEELAFLEGLTHPRIATRIRRRLGQLRKQGDVRVAVLDAPLLLKAGWDAFCDLLLFVEVPSDVREQRARERGWTRQEFQARQAAQTPLDLVRRRADVTIDNAGPPDRTLEQLETVWRSVVEMAR